MFLANINNRFDSQTDISHIRYGTILLVSAFLNRLSNGTG